MPWESFAVIVGGAAAGLVGLLFVAVSIRVDVISRSAELRNRGAQTLALFVTVLFIAILLAIPDQPERVLGAELIGLSLAAGVGMGRLEYRAKVDEPSSTAQMLEAASPNLLTLGLLLVAGILLACHVHAGLYVLVGPCMSGLAGGVATAWIFLTKV